MEVESIGKLYDAYAQDVYRLALSYLRSKQDAEDICQNVFLKLAEPKITLLSGKEKAFLLTCTANACKNHLRSFWRRNVTPLDDSLVSSEPREQEIWEAVAALPPKYRAVIHLYYYEGYDQRQISEILQISQTAVQTRMSRAREKLKKELSIHE